MPEYKLNQCPDCGCEEFTSQEQFVTTYTFGIAGRFKRHDRVFVGSLDINNCKDCCADININATLKQGKIILA